VQSPILITGAGPAGLCSSISLSRLGIRSVLLERHPSTSIHPKATGVSTRTMELFRAWGLEPRIRELALDVDFVSSVRDTLAAPEAERRPLGYPTRDEAVAFSPTAPAVLAQDVLEPILADHARSYSTAELRFNTELCSFEQTGNGVSAVVVDRATGERTAIDARYMIAADGANSLVRRQLGIAMHGVERIGEYLSILFRADLERVVGERQCGLYMLQGLGGPAPSVALPTSRDGRWVLATPWRGDARPLSSMSQADYVALVRRAAGVPDMSVDLLDVQLIGIGAQVAERFRDGNVFLVGDAAHRTAPTGGTGMNTAIHSAHNLAWKLAAVMSGAAGEELLDSYEPERRPSGERNVLRSRGQLQGVSGIAADMGVVYSSGATMAEDGSEGPAVIEPTDIACVGSRAPHIWLDADGDRLSIHDLFGHRLVLLTGVNGEAWRRAARHVSDSLRVPLGAITIGGAELTVHSSDWTTMYGIESDGAVLVRPDGHIAWRSPSVAADTVATLETVVARVLGRGRTQNGELAPSIAGVDRRCA
jgi:2-polyprenyl-6-methoxyphenol hydroxylase-like FAD-dependent oxidoreductase